ncbi:acyl-CoA dehydrogenase/oxidase C-terminal [Radiomyces spectabilis]|uniref:acyl-CoA dehydrogenase/oxidase C-terminal n=1 Tax=Radiomyces spectabilis TaxID=64574 RepID=UPI00221F9CC9|nr:acyl-CoA dehydrogenase/oxidase C-terminal [Radiomyces spectabilis]KAI8379209.1 acyl-CoA dehydrogenase/oxidase C-terminal [Radiomyces spectabilis]
MSSPQQRINAVKQQLTPEQVHAKLVDPVESMREERAKASFNIRDLTYLLDGGQKQTELKERMMLELERDPLFKMDDIHDISKSELRERTMEKFRSLLHHLQNESVDTFRKRMEVVSMIDPGFWTRFGVHYGLFVGALQSNATPGQLGYWFEKGALSLNGMIGCFAMTELGHGSNVPGLETTATFDEASDQFIIHTPTLTATKWWIGGAAHSATHAAVFAQLIVKGKRYGTKCFVVPLRDPKTYLTLPGINIGDIGKKMGRDGIDNGYIQFTNVRIPRGYMLQKHTKVSRSGAVKEPKLQQLTYGALLQGRVAMVVDSGNVSKKALSIAIRYAAVRRQFASSKSGGIETKLLDYPIHQRRLMPLLAQTFAMLFTGAEMTAMYNNMMNRLENAKSGDKDLEQVLEMLKETHSTSAGLKAFCTWNCLNTIEQCRQACGGHGYSAYTGLAGMYQDFAVQCTWEGDNTILTLQAGRYLISSFNEAMKGKTLSPGVGYLNKLDSLIGKKCTVQRMEDIVTPEVIIEGWQVVCANVVKNAAMEFDACRKRGLDIDDAYEECSQSRLYAAKLHSYGYLFNRFADGVAKVTGDVKRVLMDVCMLYGLYTVEENAGAFLQYEYFTPAQVEYIRSVTNQLCKSVRDQAIPLVDSFNLTDYMINSPLGRADGNVYVHYFEQVQRSNPQGEHPYFNRLIKPLIERSIDAGEIEDEEAGLEEEEDDEE